MSPKTEREKMLAGETYNCLDPGLNLERQQVKRLLRLFNQAETSPEQLALLQQWLWGIGQNSLN